MTKALIIGASGQVGGQLANIYRERNHQFIMTHCNNATEVNSKLLDISNKAEVFLLIGNSKPKFIYLPAGMTNVDYCEQNPNQAYKVNVVGTCNVLEAARRHGAKLIFFSTDYIFDGGNGPYAEDDLPNPLSEYGKQKLIAEHLIATQAKDYLIIRTTIVYGWERQGKNFVIRLIKKLRENQEVQVPVDQIGTPTFAPYLAKTTVMLAESEAQGIYNIAGKDLVSRYEFACEIAEAFNLNKNLISSVSTSELRQPAPRPLNAGIKIDKISRTLNIFPSSYKDNLRLMAREYDA